MEHGQASAVGPQGSHETSWSFLFLTCKRSLVAPKRLGQEPPPNSMWRASVYFRAEPPPMVSAVVFPSVFQALFTYSRVYASVHHLTNKGFEKPSTVPDTLLFLGLSQGNRYKREGV